MTEVQAQPPAASSMPPQMLSGLPQHGKNYMSYSSDLGYDDARYEDFVTTNYGVFNGSQEIARSDGIPRSGAGRPPGSPAMNRTFGAMAGMPPSQLQMSGMPPSQLQMSGPSAPARSVPVFPIDNYHSCPLCKEMAISTCGCPFRDAHCGKGHSWFLNQNKMKELGVSPNHRA